MQKAVQTLVLAILSSTVSADWLKFGDSEVGSAYIDPFTIRKAGAKATMWEMTDYKVVPEPGNPYPSVRRLYEFNCDEMALRTLSISA